MTGPLFERISSRFDEYLLDLEALVNIDCPSNLKTGVDRAGEYVRQRAHSLGAEIRHFPVSNAGDCWYFTWRGAAPGRTFMIGHLDTVYPPGTVAAHPFRRDTQFIHGPGSIDMKAGLLAGLYAASALVELARDRVGEIGLFCNSDEEIGSPNSVPLYSEIARGADAALVLEAARESGAIVSARKGVGGYTIQTRGKAAHAGVEPEKGANAVVALAHIIQEVWKLNGLREGMTVNPAVIEGGTKTNVVPDSAALRLDLRVQRNSDAQAFEERLSEICARETIPGTHSEFSGRTRPAMEKTPATALLVSWAQEAARHVGLDIADVSTGGGSDGNMLATLGLPVLDGLGPQGGRAHNAALEYVLLDSIVPRITLLAGLLQLISAHRAELAR